MKKSFLLVLPLLAALLGGCEVFQPAKFVGGEVRCPAVLASYDRLTRKATIYLPVTGEVIRGEVERGSYLPELGETTAVVVSKFEGKENLFAFIKVETSVCPEAPTPSPR